MGVVAATGVAIAWSGLGFADLAEWRKAQGTRMKEGPRHPNEGSPKAHEWRKAQGTRMKEGPRHPNEGRPKAPENEGRPKAPE